MSILDNPLRIGNFTSSGIHALLSKDRSGNGFGKPALTYIEEKRMERRLGRALTNESGARPLVWGKLVEAMAFGMMPFDYELASQETIPHHDIDFWKGSPDGTSSDAVFDIKCPFTMKSFCQLADCETIEEVRTNHSDGDKYYWQLVSNAILTGKSSAELVVFMPLLSQLDQIRAMAEDNRSAAWIMFAEDNELPYIPDGGYYKPLNTIRFQIPQSDKNLLTEKVIEAGKMLTEE